MTRELSQRLDAGHLAREYAEVISEDVVRAGEKFGVEGGRGAGGRREEGHLQLLPSLLSGKSASGTTHTHGTASAQLGGGGEGGEGARGHRSASCCDTSRILLPTSLWGVCVCLCVVVANCHKCVTNRACEVFVFISA